MTHTLIPRAAGAKKVETTDFEKYWSCDIIKNYVQTGFTVTAQCPAALAADITTGISRVNGLYVENTVADCVSCLAACMCNYIYITVCRDACMRPDAWSYTTNTTGCVPTDSMLFAIATTNACTVTSVCQGEDTRELSSVVSNSPEIFGDGSDGCVTICGNTTLTTTKYYCNLTVNACVTLDGCTSPQIIFVKTKLTVCGTISMACLGSAGGAGGTGGTGGGDGGAVNAGGAGVAGVASVNLNSGVGGAGGAVTVNPVLT